MYASQIDVEFENLLRKGLNPKSDSILIERTVKAAHQEFNKIKRHFNPYDDGSQKVYHFPLCVNVVPGIPRQKMGHNLLLTR
jgi:hypothetical protein